MEGKKRKKKQQQQAFLCLCVSTWCVMTGMPMCPKPTETWLSAHMTHTSLAVHRHSLTRSSPCAATLKRIVYCRFVLINEFSPVLTFITRFDNMFESFQARKYLGYYGYFNDSVLFACKRTLAFSPSYWLGVSKSCR